MASNENIWIIQDRNNQERNNTELFKLLISFFPLTRVFNWVIFFHICLNSCPAFTPLHLLASEFSHLVMFQINIYIYLSCSKLIYIYICMYAKQHEMKIYFIMNYIGCILYQLWTNKRQKYLLSIQISQSSKEDNINKGNKENAAGGS